MNARHNKYRLSLELRQVKDALACFYHSLLLHRTVGKFTYREESNYTLGSVGIEEVDCDAIDLTYVRVNSGELSACIEEEVCAFYQDLETAIRTQALSPPASPSSFGCFPAESPCRTSLDVEFFQKRRRPWPLSEENVSWEVWNLVLDITRATSNDELSVMRESVADAVSNIILEMCSAINRPQYLPKMPTRSELNNVFNSAFSDCQPYLFKVVRSTPLCKPTSQLAFSTIQNVIKNTLAL